MKIVIPGGSGQVGTILARIFTRDGHEVVVLSRTGGGNVQAGRLYHKAASAPWRVVGWDANSLGDWVREFEGADAIINLAGRSVNCRYNSANRTAIKASRVNSTRAVGEAIGRAQNPPRVWLQMSTATIYAHRFDAPNDEATGIIGGQEPNAPDTWNFSIDVATSWERAASDAHTPRTRKVLMRSAVVLSPDRGGIFDVLLRLVRFGLGGRAGDGRQFVSWIHEADFVRAVYHLIERESLDGPVNLASPNPVPNAEFMSVLRRAWGVRLGLPASAWMIELGAFLLRTESELVLKSRRVVPGRLLGGGFQFHYPEWPDAARDLCEKWRARNFGLRCCGPARRAPLTLTDGGGNDDK
ncbi:MAG TPA: TIGR01777 family oxidoreductase [Planctomycetota bacterium]|nr:TIGR01777 family oxidoreductase [Planctomycetota bacterium]